MYKLDVSVIAPLFTFRTAFAAVLGVVMLREVLTNVDWGLIAVIFIAGMFVSLDERLKIKNFLQWPIALFACALFALVTGALSLRTRGVYFIMITLAFAQMTYYFAISWPAYGGEDGLSIFVRNQFPGINTMVPMSFFLLCFGVLVAVLVLFALITNSRFGAALQASRQNEVRVASVGIAPLKIRLAAFVLSGMITALAGALYADLNRFVSPSMMSWHMSGEFIVLIVLGGVGRLFGPVAGAMLFVMIEYLLGGMTDRWQFFLGLVLLAVVLFARGGLMGALAGKVRHG